MTWLSRFSLAQRAPIRLMRHHRARLRGDCDTAAQAAAAAHHRTAHGVDARAVPGCVHGTWSRSRSSNRSRTIWRRSTASPASPPRRARATPSSWRPSTTATTPTQLVADAAGAARGRASRSARRVAGLDDVTDVTSDLAQSVPRISVRANEKAAAAGFTDQTLGAAVTQAVRGTTAARATLDDTERDVVIRSARPADTLAELKGLRLGPVKLGDIADVRLVDGPVSMTRIDGQRAATVTAKPTGDNTGAVSADLQSKINSLDLPEGATAEIGGVSEDQEEAFANLGLAMLAAIAIVFMLLVATFRSLIQPLILLVSIPFAATGAIGLLLATGTPMGVPAMIGMLMLIGIVVTNAIVLIDLINQYRAQGYGVVEAVVEGGRHRLRPILMTALATIFALLPMALGITGEGGFIAQPLAVVVIGGLVTSTLLTLLLVPTLYAMIELRKERRAKKRAAKRAAKERSEEVPAAGGRVTRTACERPGPVGTGPGRLPTPPSGGLDQARPVEEVRPALQGAADGSDPPQQCLARRPPHLSLPSASAGRPMIPGTTTTRSSTRSRRCVIPPPCVRCREETRAVTRTGT
ncbi:Multidrug resistance protein MdtC [Streptomyces glaucescens]